MLAHEKYAYVSIHAAPYMRSTTIRTSMQQQYFHCSQTTDMSNWCTFVAEVHIHGNTQPAQACCMHAKWVSFTAIGHSTLRKRTMNSMLFLKPWTTTALSNVALCRLTTSLLLVYWISMSWSSWQSRLSYVLLLTYNILTPNKMTDKERPLQKWAFDTSKRVRLNKVHF